MNRTMTEARHPSCIKTPDDPIALTMLHHQVSIERWFKSQWSQTPPPITTSVDLRHSGFKIAPVDTNLFPAGYNNLSPESFPFCVKAARNIMQSIGKGHTNLLIIPENHTRNEYYAQSIHVLRTVFNQAGYAVRFGGTDPALTTLPGQSFEIEPLQQQNGRLVLENFAPCFVLLNNDLSSGIPSILKNLQEDTHPPVQLGWSSRLKSDHFQHFSDVTHEFSRLIGLDPWWITPLFDVVNDVDFMTQTGLEPLALTVDALLEKIRDKYDTHGIQKEPFVAVKANNGTYGMGVMMVNEGAQLLRLNRKQRTQMSATKGRQTISRLIIQEGIYSTATTANGAVAEPVLYLIGSDVVGGFYRAHPNKTTHDNLNAPGMQFTPLSHWTDSSEAYAYRVMARLAALAAAREIAAVRRRFL